MDNYVDKHRWWYTVTLPQIGTLSADTVVNNTVSVSNSTALSIAIYSGSSFPLNKIACKDSFDIEPDGSILPTANHTTNPSVNALVPAGTYFIAVANSISNTTADFVVTTIDFAPAALPVTMPVPVNNPIALLLLIASLVIISLLRKRLKSIH